MSSILQLKQQYDVWSESYDIESNFLIDLESVSASPRFRALEFYLRSHGRVLDIGCGTGRHAPLLASRFDEYLGVDLSEGMLSKAIQKYPELTKCFKAGSFFDIDAFESFDFVHSSLSLMHFEDLALFFSHAARLLKPEGILYVVDADPKMLQAGSSPNFDRGVTRHEVPYFIFDPAEISSAIDAARLNCLETSVTYYLHPELLESPRYDRYLGAPCLRHLIIQRRSA